MNKLDLELIKRVCVIHNYKSKFSARCINMIIADVYYEDIIRLNGPRSIISTDEYISCDQKFAEVIKIDTNMNRERIKIFRKQDEDGKVLIRTRILNRRTSIFE